jgi:hypothetical protein
MALLAAVARVKQKYDADFSYSLIVLTLLQPSFCRLGLRPPFVEQLFQTMFFCGNKNNDN